ncbi:DUF3823 domain-containing protein [Sphingobacterium sp. SRCM116780]|uniref:DUF3823 domain-containing protein n=1 Tax=Sphingobacterium sp. SRCM116780 TaxID=2907623 RepID=UPI001F1D7D8D|nr:DUF3823 domain-containing protein [Sphingobacterium sp. SRCM116780]UIR57693.1 DUF3823 domain-containing protein [Sphingobacterium sp. SRCM116780]
MKTLKLLAKICLLLFIAMGCKQDDFSQPSETFKGKFIEKNTGKPFQTAIGNTGIRIRMMEYSWSDNPQPYDFNGKMDGTFYNDKIFPGTYGVTPSGAFVPLEEERLDIKGTIEKVYEVEPILHVDWIGEPVLNADRTVTFKVKITYGSNDVKYRTPLVESRLFVSENQYVGDFSFSPNYTVILNPAQMGLTASTILDNEGIILTVTTSQAHQAFPDYSRKFFFRFGARSQVAFDATNRYNYTDIKEVLIPQKN